MYLTINNLLLSKSWSQLNIFILNVFFCSLLIQFPFFGTQNKHFNNKKLRMWCASIIVLLRKYDFGVGVVDPFFFLMCKSLANTIIFVCLFNCNEKLLI